MTSKRVTEMLVEHCDRADLVDALKGALSDRHRYKWRGKRGRRLAGRRRAQQAARELVAQLRHDRHVASVPAREGNGQPEGGANGPPSGGELRALESASERVTRIASRRTSDGCEHPATCGWMRIIRIDLKHRRELAGVPLCDFHAECLEAGIELARDRGASVRPADAIDRHPAAWRARR